MYQINPLEDTIAAIITPSGLGGIGVVRLSGPKTLEVCDQFFQAKNKVPALKSRGFSVRYGWVIRKNEGSSQEIIDEALLTIMRAPKSYTKEDVAEISCHGGNVSVRNILNLVLSFGVRLAEPGEFTKRAFLNGRLDLAQAEAVLDIIRAKTDSFLKVSLNQLKGDLSSELEEIRKALLKIYVELEAVVNFPEDDIDAAGRKALEDALKHVYRRVQKLLKSSEQGRILKEGIKVVLCGKPNVGKSSLLNILLRQKRAIVSDIAGTTRDTLEETAQIKGIPFQLIDTAGILEPRDLIEKEAIERSHQAIQISELVLFIVDGTMPMSLEDEALIKAVQNKNCLVVINKSDVPLTIDQEQLERVFPKTRILKVSALTKMGIEQLEDAIVEEVWKGDPTDAHGTLISNIRHIKALEECLACLMRSKEGFTTGLSFEFISEEIKSGINFLDSITGRNIDSDLLDKIFSEFCIGK